MAKMAKKKRPITHILSLSRCVCSLVQVIGKGGENINKLTAETGCKIQLTPKDKQAQGRFESAVTVNAAQAAVLQISFFIPSNFNFV